MGISLWAENDQNAVAADHQPLPPQELGGYGRCMADFAWGLQQRGHTLQVISSDAPYLGSSNAGPSGEPVDRRLQLKGSFQGGVHQLQDPAARAAVDANNRALLNHWLDQGTLGWNPAGKSGPSGHGAARTPAGIGPTPAPSHRLRHTAVSTRADATQKAAATGCTRRQFCSAAVPERRRHGR